MTRRADYCPVGNEPCQSLCETPCSTRKPLPLSRLNEIARDAQIAFWLGKHSSYDVAFARGIEAAHGIAPAGGIGGI